MKIAIIGAGPVGCYAAFRIAELFNIAPTIFEKKNKSQKPCSGLFSKRILDFIPLPNYIIENKINQVEINFPRKKVVVEFNPKLLVVNRKLFDDYLLKIASLKSKIVKANVKSINTKGNVFFGKKRKKFDIIIACDGALSIVRKSLSLPDPEFLLGLQFFVKRKIKSSKAITWATENGFFWQIPRKDKIEYGIMESPQKAKQKLFEFSKKLKLKPKNIQGALIPIGPVISPYENIFLCGDAAGLCKPWSGGGIIWSFTAIEIMLKYFPDIYKASEKIRKIFGRKIKIYKNLSKFVRKINFILPPKIKIDTDWLFQEIHSRI